MIAIAPHGLMQDHILKPLLPVAGRNRMRDRRAIGGLGISGRALSSLRVVSRGTRGQAKDLRIAATLVLRVDPQAMRGLMGVMICIILVRSTGRQQAFIGNLLRGDQPRGEFRSPSLPGIVTSARRGVTIYQANTFRSYIPPTRIAQFGLGSQTEEIRVEGVPLAICFCPLPDCFCVDI